MCNVYLCLSSDKDKMQQIDSTIIIVFRHKEMDNYNICTCEHNNQCLYLGQISIHNILELSLCNEFAISDKA